MPRKRKVRRKGAGLGDWATKQMISQAKAAAKAHVLPILKKHLAAFEKKLGGQLRGRKVRRRKAGSSRVGGSVRRRKKKGAGIAAAAVSTFRKKKGGSSRAAVAMKRSYPQRGVARAGSSRLGGSSRL